MGPGYFVFVCKRLGHGAAGIDQKGFLLLRLLGRRSLEQKVRKALGVTCFEHKIAPMRKLPPLGRFDLVTAFNCPFNYRFDQKRFWNKEEWAFFLDHLQKGVLKAGGRAVFELKDGGNGERNQIYDDEFIAHWKQWGGLVEDRLLTFQSQR